MYFAAVSLYGLTREHSQRPNIVSSQTQTNARQKDER